MKPKLFIGSSTEGRQVADAIHVELQSEAECIVWTQGVFGLSESNVQSLMKQVHTSEFGFFVFSPDDAVRIRGRLFSAPRDNVVYELGLFSGALGPERCFFATPESTDIHLPTDLLGMTAGWYETERRDKNMQAAVGPFCTKVRNKIRELTLGVRFVDPKPNAQLSVGQHTFTCRCTARPGPDVVLFTQKENRWWPRRARLKQTPKDADLYEIDFGFGDPGLHTIHVVRANNLGMTLVKYYSDIVDRASQQWEGLQRTGLPEATLNSLRISYPPITMEEMPSGFVALDSITVEVVPKPA
jgi:hypothetical protein